MADTIERVISESGNFFGVACNTTDLVTEACRRHDVGPLAAAALGRALTGAALLAALLKDSQSVFLKFEGSGPLKKIITEAGYDGWVRGYVANPHAEVPLSNGQIDVATGLGRAGFLTVVKDIGNNQKYPGTIQLYTSEIGEDLAYYLSQSEQTPSAIALAIHLQKDGTIAAAGGFLIQSLPPADETLLTHLEQEIAAMPPLSQLLLEGKEPAAILSQLFTKVPHKKIGTRKLFYACSCSKGKMEGALFSLGEDDIRQLLEKEDGAEVRCEFCRQSYHFSHDELTKLLKNGQTPAN
ncbi:Hsp33 family molecular chaperone HslO [Desulfopila sp. IMCC35006]|nr:Hsp33 family molecular chaperone HslO [Desulfopila sp. IMCC35006]TKB27101.1 Hsp33 family molecular chaperone HslO [Desulfopila sp. IMCC35006]